MSASLIAMSDKFAPVDLAQTRARVSSGVHQADAWRWLARKVGNVGQTN